jgi:cation-transporting ATPase 13A2
MSVIVKNNIDSTFRAYIKGSPEKVAELCLPESLPANFDQQLEVYTKKGYRVIALAYKILEKTSFLKINSTKRDDIEHNLHFLGFLVMENKLKSVTSEIIKTLNNCKVRTIMATGDNTLTAISVARQCQILNIDQDVYFGDIIN